MLVGKLLYQEVILTLHGKSYNCTISNFDEEFIEFKMQDGEKWLVPYCQCVIQLAN